MITNIRIRMGRMKRSRKDVGRKRMRKGYLLYEGLPSHEHFICRPAWWFRDRGRIFVPPHNQILEKASLRSSTASLPLNHALQLG
jgi:hypothetical protein